MLQSERFDIYVPTDVDIVLKHDALLFEFFKRDGVNVNNNGFLNALIKGYYNLFIQENSHMHSQLISIVQNYVGEKAKQSELAEQICDAILFHDFDRKKGSSKARVSLKPTRKIFEILSGIPEEAIPNGSISRYLRKLLLSYSRKPLCEREQIVFADTYMEINDACANGRNLILITKKAPQIKHHVIPYCITTGEDEMFNYLLCEEIGSDNVSSPMTYRLNRILRVGPTQTNNAFTQKTKERLIRMKERSPQYIINSDDLICIRMSQAGEKLYRNIYHNRPPYLNIVQEGVMKLYYFDCSVSQAFMYFRKLEQDTIEVVQPYALKKQLKEFFQKAVIPLELSTNNYASQHS